MDLIANIISFVVTFIAGVVGNVVAHDICATADARCSRIIGRAAKRLAPFDIEATELEWLADLGERETVRDKYRHAFGCYLAAPRMRRQATTVRIDVTFKVASVGSVPLNIAIGPVFGQAVLSRMGGSSWTRKQMLKGVIIYYFLKVLLAAHKLGPGCAHRFLNDVKNFKNWDFDVKVRRRSSDLDLSKIMKLWALDRKKGQLAMQKLAEILAVKSSGGKN